MTQPNYPPIVVTASPSMFELIQKGSIQEFEKEVSELSFNEAAQLVGGILVASAQSDGVTGYALNREEGHIIVDSIEDGKDAFVGHSLQLARNIAPQIDDDREIILNVTRNQTLWEAIRNRKPKVTQTYRFRKEPPQYA